MDFHVELTDQAKSDVAAIHAWLVDQEAGSAGTLWFAALRQAIDSLRALPARCPQSPVVSAGADHLDAFVQAPSQGAAETAGRVSKDVPFDVAWRRLKAGRAYQAERTGRVEMPTADYGARLDNVLEVPADYAPTRAWPLRPPTS